MTTSQIQFPLNSNSSYSSAPEPGSSPAEFASKDFEICVERPYSFRAGERLDLPVAALRPHPSFVRPDGAMSSKPTVQTNPLEATPSWQKVLGVGAAALVFPFMIAPAAGLVLLTSLSGCGGGDETGATSGSASVDSACVALRHEIETYVPDPKYQSMVDALVLPTIDFSGHNYVDSKGKSINSFQPSKSDIVNYATLDNKLYLLTRNETAGIFAPATLLVYPIIGSKLASPLGAVTFAGVYNPVWMSSSGGKELHVLFGPPSDDIMVKYDPKMTNASFTSSCSPKGTHLPDAGVTGRGGLAGSGGASGYSGAGTSGAAGQAGTAGHGGSGGAGHGGSGGSAGKGGAGGSSGSAGKGGAAGNAGKAGTGGK